MKKWITLSVGLLMSGFLFGQTENTQEKEQPMKGYEINGLITGKYTGKVYLVKEDGMHGPQTKVDSCEVIDGRFQFKGDSVPEQSVSISSRVMTSSWHPSFWKQVRST